MKLTFSFQTLILSMLAATLTVATAVWAVTVYQSVYSVILRGFDQKLLALSGGAAVFTDGDAHAAYQRERRLTAFTQGVDGQLWGFDASRQQLVRVDPETGSATPLPTIPAAANLRALAYSPVGDRLVALNRKGRLLALRGEIAEPAAGALDGVEELLFLDGILFGRVGQTLRPLELGGAERTLSEPVTRLGIGADGPIGLNAAGDALLQFAADGSVRAQTPIALGERKLAGLAQQGNTVYLAAESLLRFDLESGDLNEDAPPGYYSEADPFIEAHAPAYRWVRETTGLTFLYTELHIGEDTIRYILDGSVGEDHTPPGTLDTVPEDSLDEIVLAQSRGQPFVSDIRQWEQWGLIKVSGEPIRNGEGKVVAVAGADVDIGVIRAKTRNALFAVLFVGASVLVLAGSVSLRVSQGLTRPLREIKDAALRIAAGYFDTRLNRRGRDEIGVLASSLDTLSERLDAQARQSEAYERALIDGRVELALQHALIDQLATAAASVPADRAASEAVTCVGDAERALVWHSEAAAAGLQRAIVDAQTAALALALLERLPPEQALDALFDAQPQLQAAGLWRAQQRLLNVRCRATWPVRRVAADGALTELSLSDRSQVQLGADESLHWSAQLRLYPSAIREAGA